MVFRPEVLIDCDGVLGDTVGDVLKLINQVLKTDFRRDDVNLHDIFQSLGIPEHEKIWDEDVANNQFCLKMTPYAEAQRAVKELQTFCDVYCVTAPGAVSPWMHERTQWLIEHMGISKKHIVQTHAKYLVNGNMLIDDKAEHIINWKNRRLKDVRAVPVLFETKYATEDHLPPEFPAVVTNNWDEIIRIVRELTK